MRFLVASLLLTTTAFAAAARAAREAKRPAVVAAVLMAGLAGCFGGDTGGDGGGDAGDGPEANIVVLPGIEAPAGTEFTFDGTTSKGAKAFFWNFGDGTTAEGSVVKHTFGGDNGRFPVSLVATDSKGNRGVDLEIVKVGAGANGAPTATMTADNFWIGLGESMTFTVDASDPDNDTLSYYWTVSPSAAASSGGGNESDVHAGHGADAAAAQGPCDLGLPECMEEAGDTYSTVFDAPGIYVYHCHPHPWMKQLIIVEEGGPTEPVTSTIDNFRFVEPVTRVGVGTNVTWKNLDPLPHTATQEAAHAGTPLPDTGPTATWTPDALGDYMVMALVRDEKPYTGGDKFDYLVGEAMPMLDVRVEDVAPQREDHWTHSGTYPATVFLPSEGPGTWTHHYNFTGNTTMTLTWSSPTEGTGGATVALEIWSGSSAEGQPAISVEDTTGEIVLVKDLPGPDKDYTFRVTPIEGLQIEYELKIDVIYDVRPPSAGGAHAHH